MPRLTATRRPLGGKPLLIAQRGYGSPPIIHDVYHARTMPLRRAPQSGGDFWGDIDGFFKNTKILSTVAAPAITAAGIGLGGLFGPVGSAVGASGGAVLGDYAAQQLSQAGYGKKRKRSKATTAKRKTPVKRKAPTRKRK
jgi:hypothetical protein